MLFTATPLALRGPFATSFDPSRPFEITVSLQCLVYGTCFATMFGLWYLFRYKDLVVVLYFLPLSPHFGIFGIFWYCFRYMVWYTIPT
jgi:hypothetical protein